MDYIREELLRQRMVWSVLLLGGQRQEEREQAQAAMHAEESAAEAEAVWAREDGGLPRPMADQEKSVLPAQSGQTALNEGKSAAGPGGALQKGPGKTSLAAGQAGTGAALPEALAGSVVFRRNVGGEQGAKALSRVFQRDARRYDGGFSLY